MRTFKCAICERTYETDQADDWAMNDLKANFGGHIAAGYDIAEEQICTTCYNAGIERIRAAAKQETVEIPGVIKLTIFTDAGDLTYAALRNWYVRTKDHSAQSFCDYINSKGVHIAFVQLPTPYVE